MNDIKMTNRSEIVYRGDELIVRNAFTVGTESYDIVVKYLGIQRLGVNVPADLAERIKGIWQRTSALLPNNLTAVFTWDKNRILVNGKNVPVKQGVNPMKQLHELIVGRFYQGISPISVTTTAQPSATATTSIHVEPLPSKSKPKSRKRSSSGSNTASVQPPVTNPSVSIGLPPEPPSPKSKPSKPVPRDSSGDILISPVTSAPATLGPNIDLTDDVAATAFDAVLQEQRRERANFFNSLQEPLQAIKQGNVQKDNKAVLFLTAFAREIRKTQPDDCVFLAVNHFCTHPPGLVAGSGVSFNELLTLTNQQLID